MRIRILVAGVCVFLGGLLLIAGAEDARAILIDDFSTGQAAFVITPAGSGESQVSGSGILGGERDMIVTLVSSVGVGMSVAGDAMTYGHFANSEGTGLITWDGADGSSVLDPIGLGGVDFTNGGTEDRIGIPLLVNNFAATMTLTAYTDAVNYSTATVFLLGGVPPQTALSVLFTDFTATGSGADFTNIGAFSLYIDGSSTPGLTVGFATIPEPSTATLLLFGLLGVAKLRRSS
jgi:hypothetical protein